MTYTTQTWNDGDVTTPLTAARLAHMESGIAAAGAGLAPTAVKTADYTAVSGDLVRVDTTSVAVTVTLPAAAAGATVGVKLVTLGGSNAVTIAAAGSDVFNKTGGSTTLTLSLLNQGAVLVAISGVWVVQADDLALSQLDTRYRTQVMQTGTAAPSNAVGANGDFYTDTTNGYLYGPKAAGVWPNTPVKLQSAPIAPGFRGDGFIPAAAKQAKYTYGAQSDGIVTDGNSRIKQIAAFETQSLRIVYANFSNSDPMTVRGAIEIGSTTVPVFFNGKRDVVIDAEGFAVSDPIGVRVAKNGTYWVRTHYTVASGAKWRINLVCETGETTDTSTTDRTLSGTISGGGSGGTGFAFGAWMTLLRPVKRVACTCWVGDSIVDGAASTSGVVFWRTACEGKISVANAGYTGDTTTGWTTADMPSPPTNGFGRERRSLMLGANNVIFNFGSNDFFVLHNTTAQMQAAALLLATQVALQGANAYWLTVAPRTTTTDAFATLANQTTTNSTDNTARTGFNDWLRDGSPIDSSTLAAVAIGTVTNVLRAGAVGHPLSGYIELADAVESSRNSGKWKVDGTANKYTGDGIHPSDFGHIAIGTAIGDPTLIFT